MFLGIFRGLLFVKAAVLWGTVHLRYYPLYLPYISACVKKSLHTVYSSISFNRKYLFALCNGSENSTRSHLTCAFQDLQLPSDSSVCAICPNPISTLCDKALFSVFCDVLKVKSWRVPPPCLIWKKVGGVGGSELLTWQFFHRSLHAYTPYSEWCSKARVQTRDLIYEYVDNTFNCFFNVIGQL